MTGESLKIMDSGHSAQHIAEFSSVSPQNNTHFTDEETERFQQMIPFITEFRNCQEIRKTRDANNLPKAGETDCLVLVVRV